MGLEAICKMSFEIVINGEWRVRDVRVCACAYVEFSDKGDSKTHRCPRQWSRLRPSLGRPCRGNSLPSIDNKRNQLSENPI